MNKNTDKKTNRRELFGTIAVFAAGIGTGLLIPLLYRGRKNNPGSFEPLFKINIFSEEYLRDNYNSKKINEIKEMCGETNGYTEFCYLHPSFSSVSIFRNGEQICEDFKQTNSYRFILSREIGTVPYTFVLNKGRISSPEEIKIRADFKTDYELECCVTNPDEKGIGPKLEFLDYKGNFPRRARVMGENKVIYDICGLEAVCRGVTRELLEEYFKNKEKYSKREGLRESGFEGFKKDKGIR
jgi:hypothetical protein